LLESLKLWQTLDQLERDRTATEVLKH
jgi:hypothetical protein